MNELIKKQWNYRLFKNSSNEYILSVLCGTVGLYEIEVKLTKSQVDDYELKGESVIDELAQDIREDSKDYTEKN